jgi:hypothetical protein
MKRLVSMAALIVMAGLGVGVIAQRPAAPRTWDADALREWATPLAGLNERPGHFSEAEYQRAPIDNLRSYPVYYPGREPAGYWDALQTAGPKPLIEPAMLSTEADWIRAGTRVFEEYDVPAFRVADPKAIAAARNPLTFARSPVKARPDGTLPDLRWVPTGNGVKLGLANCASCHIRAMNDGTLVHGAPQNESGSPFGPLAMAPWAVSPIPLAGDSPGMMTWRSFGVPWLAEDIHAAFKTMPAAQAGPLISPAFATRTVSAVEWQPVLSDQDPGSDRVQRPQVHRSHSDPPASRPRRPDALRGAGHLQRCV